MRRTSDTTGTEVRVPAPGEFLPLMMTGVIYPDKDRFDEAIAQLEETDINCFEDYVYAFIRGVDMNVSKPMTELQIKRQLQKIDTLKK